MGQSTMTVTLPCASSPLARWFEDHSAKVELSCASGKWQATLSWRAVYTARSGRNRKPHRYSEERSVERIHEDPAEAMRLVWEAAQAVVVSTTEERR